MGRPCRSNEISFANIMPLWWDILPGNKEEWNVSEDNWLSPWLQRILSTGEPLLRHLRIQNLDLAHRYTPPSWPHVNENTYCPGVISSSFSLYLSLSHLAWNSYHFTTDVTKWHSKTFSNYLMPVGFQRRISLTKPHPPMFLLSLKTPLLYVWVSPDACQQEFLQEIVSQPSSCYLYDKMGQMLMIEGNRSRGASNARPSPSTPREEGFNKCLNTTSGHRHTTEALL